MSSSSRSSSSYLLQSWPIRHLRHGRRRGTPRTGSMAEKGGLAIVDHRANVRGVALEALGEAMALVVNGGDGEPNLGEVHGGELDHLARFVGEAVDDGNGAEDGHAAAGDPALGENAEPSRVDEGG